MARYEIIDDGVGDAGLFVVVLYIMSIIWGMYISRVVFINASGHPTYFRLFLGYRKVKIYETNRG